jgi:hypothetical protein
MFLFDLFRSFLPLHNPIGFGAADFIEFALGALLISLILLRAAAAQWWLRIAKRTGVCMFAVGALTAGLRFALLP